MVTDRSTGRSQRSAGHEAHDDEEVHRGHHDGQQQQARSSRHADGRGLPDCGGRRQPVHRAAPEDDDARAEKADARDDLGRDTGRVDDDEPSCRTSEKPYLLTSRIRAAAVPTMVCVRSPALLPWISRSSPINAVSPNATNSSMI